ncbi:hypothetical protein K502DRAFT_353753 [Neoconidiobolus thromboides FSU 785]|nr:hypothetical protein K502DRAFT_353753 [Neoconidiobolus thromboides FSU 785]
MGLFGYSDFNGCYLKTDDEAFARTFHFFTNPLVMFVCMAYLLIVVILVLIKLYRGLTITEEQKLATDNSRLLESIKHIKLLASRILLYPIIMIFTHIGLALGKTIYDLSGADFLGLDAFTYITLGMLGTLNFIAFCCDPTIHSAVKEIYLRFVNTRPCDSTDITNSFV